MEITRRKVLVGMGTALGGAALGTACGSDGTGAGVDASGEPDGGAGVDAAGDGDAAHGDGGDPGDGGPRDGGPRDGGGDAFPDDAAITGGDGGDASIDWCTEPGTLTPEQLLGGIDHFVVLCMENRSFDHYLGSLRLIEGRADIDGLTGAEVNLDDDGAPVAAHLLEDFTVADPPHGWDACHQQWNNGANDGFVQAHAGSSEQDVMGYHVREQLPITYALADAGAICQRWFASVMGPTWPNRFYLHGATSNGQQGNFPLFGGFTSIFDRLDDAEVTHTNFYHDLAWCSGGYFKLGGLAPVEQFFERAAAGTLPTFSLIDPHFFGAGANDDHPDHDIQLGQALIASVVAAMAQSSLWNRCMIVVTYDEHGGFFDHVPPPTTVDDDADFTQMGFRVPSLVIGPKVRRNCAIDTVFEHASVIATLTKRFGLAPLNDRALAAADLSPCLDPRWIDDPQPPPVLPPVAISRGGLERRLADPARAAHAQGAHRELADVLAAHPLPRALDRRDEANEVTRRVLAWAERLGAIRYTP